MSVRLPVAGRYRWQPLRTGLIDLYYYDCEEFWFRDGRVLFRGNNGTGKSKVLALTLPFLLDGDLSPSRVEPDGDRDKRMEWNLLLGGKYDERLGYSWLEFGRVTDDGERAYVTIGCGLKAVQGRGIADRWFFLTSQRVGQDLFLIGPSGTALTRERLREAIGLHGEVTQTGERYRRMLDEHLFQLGADRYDALINLLIQLRQPQLSKRPDEARLSRALSEALTPVDQAVLSDIATAFHDLEQQREELRGLRETRDHVRRFLERYQRYAAVAARRQGRELRGAHAGYEDIQRSLSVVRSRIADESAHEAATADSLQKAEGMHNEQMAIRDELSSDPRLKNLADCQRYAEETAAAAARARQAANRAASTCAERQRQVTEAEGAATHTRHVVTGTTLAADQVAADAGIGSEHAGVLAPLGLPEDASGHDETATLSDERINFADRAAKDLADRRLQATDHVIGLAETAKNSDAALQQARMDLTAQEQDWDTARDRLAEREEALARASRAHVAAWRSYAGHVTELEVPDPDEIGLAAWTETLDGPNPADSALRQAAQNAQQALAEAWAAEQARLTEAESRAAILEAERARLEAGGFDVPPVPHTRAENMRDGRPGAPLWQVVDFRAGLGNAQRAGLEAALESSGLLDAWITPDGRLLEAGTLDVVLTPGAQVSDSLAGVLRPIPDATPPPGTPGQEAVAAVLAGIGLGEQDAAAWADTDGRWRLGPLRGQWAKPAAEYVGEDAREGARRRRLDNLADLIGDARESAARSKAGLETIAHRRRNLSAELHKEPPEQELRDEHSALSGARSAERRAHERVEKHQEHVGRSEHDAEHAARERDEAAADLRVPAEMDALREVRDAVTAYRSAMVELIAAVRRHADRLSVLLTWREELAAASDEHGRADSEARDAEARADSERSRLEALNMAIGASVEELEDRLARAKKHVRELSDEIKRLELDHQQAGKEISKAEGREEQLTEALTEKTNLRDAAVRNFQRFVATGLLAVACDAGQITVPDTGTPWSPDPAVRLARRAEQLLADVDDGDEAWRRIQDEIAGRYQELSEALSRHSHHAVAGLDDWFVVAIQFQGQERAPGELTELLDGEIGYRERLLTAKERDLLEEHLVSDVASHLQELISGAEAQVGEMNAELEERPTSTGMRLRLRWEPRPDGPLGLAEARSRLLRQEADLWSPADRAAVGSFLQRQIEAVRAEDEHGTWSEHLRRALDYRSWHRFVIERFQDGRWRPATGPASGGERVLTVSLPLFAAASAHYRSAHPQAPRLVALDEAFAGVDDDARSKCLGLLATFDLDVSMTSEREWGFYATVPGIAAHHLVRREGIDAVHVTTWEWDGAEPGRVERVSSARAPGNGDRLRDDDAIW